MHINLPSKIKFFTLKGDPDSFEELTVSYDSSSISSSQDVTLEINNDGSKSSVSLFDKETRSFSDYLNTVFADDSKKPNSNLEPFTLETNNKKGKFVICYDNMGEPFRDGLLFCITHEKIEIYCFIESSEAVKLKKIFNQLPRH
jgi:hypothetical protein